MRWTAGCDPSCNGSTRHAVHTLHAASPMLRQLTATAALSAVSAVLSRGVTFLGLLLAAHALGPESFGQLALIQTTALLFTTFCALSLGQVAIKIVSEVVQGGGDEVGRAMSVAYGAAIAISAVLSLAVVMLSPLLSTHVGGSSALAPAYAVSALLIVTGCIGAIQNGIALATGRMRSLAKANLVGAPVALGAMLLAILHGEFYSILIGYIAAQSVFVICQEITLLRYRKTDGSRLVFSQLTAADWAPVWKIGLPSSVAGLMTLPAMWLVMVMLAKGQNGAIELGNFALGNQVKAILMFGIGVVANAALARMSLDGAGAKGGGQLQESVVRKSIALVAVATAVGSAVIASLATAFLPGVYPEYAGAVTPLLLLLISVVLTAPTAILMRRAIAVGRPVQLIVANGSFAVMLIAGGWRSVQAGQGAVGLAAMFVLASGVQLMAMLLFWLRPHSAQRQEV